MLKEKNTWLREVIENIKDSTLRFTSKSPIDEIVLGLCALSIVVSGSVVVAVMAFKFCLFLIVSGF